MCIRDRAYTIDRQVGFQQVVETQIHLNPAQDEQMAALQPEDRAVQLQRMATGYRYVTYATPVPVSYTHL